MKPLSNKPCFIFIDSAITIFLDSENPFTDYNFSVREKWNKSPGIISEHKNCIFLFRSLQPIGIIEILFDRF